MLSEALEISIAQYADGTLPAGERGALEAICATDPRAAALLAEYRAVDAALGASHHPAIQWNHLAEHIAGVIGEYQDRAIPEEIEFALAQYADGSLSDAERPALEARLADNPGARLMLADYAALDRALKQVSTPTINWDRLAGAISQAIAQQSAPLSEETEFAIAQFADGTLDPSQVDATEASLLENAAARRALTQYEQIDALARSAPLPQVNWNRLAMHLSGAVAQADIQTQPSSYPIFAWARAPMRLAAAASVLLAIGIGAMFFRYQPRVTRTTVAEIPTPTLHVSGPSAEVASGKPIEQITIGPPPALAEMPDDDLISRPTRSIVTAGAVAERDTFPLY